MAKLREEGASDSGPKNGGGGVGAREGTGGGALAAELQSAVLESISICSFYC